MRAVSVVIGCILLLLAVVHAFIPHLPKSVFVLLYGAGALLAFLTLFSNMHLLLARMLALGTTAVMFFYFAAFFKMAPHFQEQWYQSPLALEALSMLLSAFAMIPVLSSYSCILKADCRETLTAPKPRSRPAFFSVPEGVQE